MTARKHDVCFGVAIPGMDAYINRVRIPQHRHDARRFWVFRRCITSLQRIDGTMIKGLESFPEHMDQLDDFRALLDEYASHGVKRPSGYADVFHKLYRSPRVNWSVNARLIEQFAGGWQAILSDKGVHRGHYYKYDLRSAYLWALTLGLPDPKSFRKSSKPSQAEHGIFRVLLTEPAHNAPYPFNTHKDVLASPEEIDTYGLSVGSVVAGVSWSKSYPIAEEPLRAIYATSTWKQAGRSYWGRWAQSNGITCVAGESKWDLPAVALNIPWAHAIVSRVKLRLWRAVQSAGAIHVYVDSLITQNTLPLGDKLGDWRLESEYPDGVILKGPGQYGSLHAKHLERMTGVPKGSSLRDTQIAMLGNCETASVARPTYTVS